MPPTMVAMERDTPGIIAMHWKSPMRNAFASVSSVFRPASSRKMRSVNSMKMPPRMSITATTVTLSSSSSILSLKRKPKMAAGMKATSSFQ